jgi:DNA-binding transcriptional LysR family regulator
VAPFLTEFLRANPKIDLTIDCGLWPDRPMSGEVDLTLTFTDPKQSELVVTPLAHFHYQLFASREYLDLYGTPATWAEAITHPLIYHVAQNQQRETWKPKDMAFHDLAQMRVRTNSSAVSFTAVKNGAGLGGMPTAILSLEPSLVMIDLPPGPTIKLWLVHQRNATRSPRIRRVVDWLSELFDPRTKPWYREEFIHPRDFEAAMSAGPWRAADGNEDDAAKRRRCR